MIPYIFFLALTACTLQIQLNTAVIVIGVLALVITVFTILVVLAVACIFGELETMYVFWLGKYVFSGTSCYICCSYIIWHIGHMSGQCCPAILQSKVGM